jgi:hypothetical protein
MCLRAPPCHPKSPHQRNRPGVPSVTAATAVSSADLRGHHRRLRHRRPVSGQADLTGEPRVSSHVIPPSLLSVEPCSATGVAGRRAMLAEGSLCLARGQPGSHGWASGPTSQCPWVNRPRCKKSLRLILNTENIRKCSKLVQFINSSLFIRKFQMIYQNAQKNVIYLFMSIIMHYKQL